MITFILALLDNNDVLSVPWPFYPWAALLDIIIYGTWSEKK